MKSMPRGTMGLLHKVRDHFTEVECRIQQARRLWYLTEEGAKRLSGADGQAWQILQGLVGHWVTEILMHAAWSLPVAANEANPDAR